MALSAVVSAAILSGVVALDVVAIRDLAPPNRSHMVLDLARLISTALVAVFAAVVGYLHFRYPTLGFGDAGLFAAGAAASGSLTMLIGASIAARRTGRGRDMRTAAQA